MVEKKLRPQARVLAVGSLVFLVIVTVIYYFESSNPVNNNFFQLMFYYGWGVGTTGLVLSMPLSILEARIKVLEEKLSQRNV
jgi:hypothetical protein